MRSGHCRRVVFAGRRRAVAPVRQQPRRSLSVTGSTLAWAQRAVSPSSESFAARGLVGELVSSASRRGLCQLPVGAHPCQPTWWGNGWVCGVIGQSTVGGSQPGRTQGGGTRGYIRWMADAIWIPGAPSMAGRGRAFGRDRRCGRPDHLVRRRRFRGWRRLLAHGRQGVRLNIGSAIMTGLEIRWPRGSGLADRLPSSQPAGGWAVGYGM
jgi:hypothetical protein